MQSIPMFIRGVRVRGMDTFHVYHKATGGADRRDLCGGGLYCSLAVAHACAEHLEVGVVIIGDSATFCMDNMLYGGVKDSGVGKKGSSYAIRKLTKEKLIVLNVEI